MVHLKYTNTKKLSFEQIKKMEVHNYIYFNFHRIIKGMSQKEFYDCIPMPENKNFPLLVIPAFVTNGIVRQMQLAGIDRQFDPYLVNWVKDLIKTPSEPYWIYGIHPTHENIDNDCRPITLTEGIACYIQGLLHLNPLLFTRYEIRGSVYRCVSDIRTGEEKDKTLVIDLEDLVLLDRLVPSDKVVVDHQRALHPPIPLYCKKDFFTVKK